MGRLGDVAPRLARAAPLVWTLHDMWALTGHCVYATECDRWLDGCLTCPDLAAPSPIRRDTAGFLFRQRAKLYAEARPVLVAPSRWLCDEARRAPLTRDLRVEQIPYGLDTEAFRPIGRTAARRVLRLDEDEKVVLFCALTLNARRKGADLLLQALQALKGADVGRLRLLAVGQEGADLARRSPFPVHDLGEVDNDLLMATAYCASDVFVLPTRADNLPLVLQESMACGTPCVSFRVGGVPEAVRPGETGWLAEPEDADDLARCLARALKDDAARDAMAANCRRVAEAEYGLALMTQRYMRLYEELIEERARGTMP